jgi:4-hydroxybenzoate polyprenyltransferase
MMCVTDWAFTLGVLQGRGRDRLRVLYKAVTLEFPYTPDLLLWWIDGVIASVIRCSRLGLSFFAGAFASGLWILPSALTLSDTTPERAGALFLNGSNYRAIMFGSMTGCCSLYLSGVCLLHTLVKKNSGEKAKGKWMRTLL